ncbi:MAG: hypothetical protein V1809_00665 [Planctomycetota bacterium]
MALDKAKPAVAPAEERPKNDIYTWLLVMANLFVIAGMVLIYLRYNSFYGEKGG